jgi:AAA ATPase domain
MSPRRIAQGSSQKAVSSKVRRKNRRNLGPAMFSIRLTDFRCFGLAPAVDVKPITFLVGENSTGKTSFMAATRLLLEVFTRPQLNPFNRDPYRLGGFDQIANVKSLTGGRAEKFSLEFINPDGARQRYSFKKGDPNPELAAYEFGVSDLSIEFLFEESAVKARLMEGGTEIFHFEPKNLPPVSALIRDLVYTQFLFQNLIGTSDPNIAPDIKQHLENLVQKFHRSMRSMAMQVFAFAPVRTEPKRIYTPSDIVASAEGEHVPLEMARHKVSKKQWGSVHDQLAQFGKSSGLYKDIDVRLLGSKKEIGDPFQITLKIAGSPMNIVDVGYGVSQALPIIYQLQQSQMYQAFMLQQPEVHLHPRAQAELGTLIAHLSQENPAKIYMVETHSDYIIDRVRMEVAAKKIPHQSVTVVFFERKSKGVEATNIYLTPEGDLENVPEGFRSFFLQENRRLLGI